MLTGAALAVFVAGAAALQRRRPNFDRATLVAALVFILLAGAALTSPGFREAASAAGKGAVTGVATSRQHAPVQLTRNSPSAAIARIQKLAATEGAENSLSARIDLLKNAIVLIQARPLIGYGLTNAQSFIPHNTILLFMLAFGIAGAAIPIGLVGLMAWAAWPRIDLMAIPLAFFILMFGSHDLLLSNTLVIFIPLAFAAIEFSTEGDHIEHRPAIHR
jgi:O-antigen ligase